MYIIIVNAALRDWMGGEGGGGNGDAMMRYYKGDTIAIILCIQHTAIEAHMQYTHNNSVLHM